MSAPGVYVHNDKYQEALSLIREFVAHEDGPCWLDHHGNCQEHGFTITDGEEVCSVKRGRKLLGLST